MMNHRNAVVKDKTCPTANPPVCADMRKKPNVEVWFRKTDEDQNGLRKQHCRAATCDDLVQFAKSELQPTWSAFGISEDPILVVQEAAKEPGTDCYTSVVEKQCDDPVQTDRVYTILECWKKTPVQLLRRVRLDDTDMTTYTHPDRISPWTRLSPFACAALRQNETQVPWCSALSKNGSVNVHGISLGLNDDATRLPAAVDPFEPIPIGSNESIGTTSMSLAQYDGLVPETETRHSERGILHTSISHEDSDLFVRGKDSQVTISGKNKRAGQVTKRMVNWRFALPEGFDLKEHGMMLVWDNRHVGHCCLVRLKDTGETRAWVGGASIPFLPMDAFDACQEFLDDPQGFDEVLRNVAFVCFPDEEPEPIRGAKAIGGKKGIAFPKLASQFTLYDIRMEATAEPQPLQNFRNDPQMKLYQAVVVLYYVNSDSWIQQLIQGVGEVDYEAEKLSSVECSMLVEAIDLASTELDDETEDAKGKLEKLEEGRDVLYELLSSSLSNAPPTTPAPPRQAPSQGGSPDSGTGSELTAAMHASSVASEVHLGEDLIGSSSSESNGSSFATA